MCQYPDEQNIKTNDVRTAMYLRASTSTIASHEYQKQNLLQTIEKHPNWKLANIYFDVAPHSTPLEKRAGFQALLNDCKNGKIDLVVTKNMSRFGKNLIGCMYIVHLLKSLPHPVSVFFDDENLLVNHQDKEL